MATFRCVDWLSASRLAYAVVAAYRSVAISGMSYPFFGVFLAALTLALDEEAGVFSTSTRLAAVLRGCATDGAAVPEAELLELLDGDAGGGALDPELLELELLSGGVVGGALAAAAVFRFGIEPNVNDSVERCCGSGRAVGAGNMRLALAGAVEVAPCTLSSDFTCTFIFVTVVWTPPALCAACWIWSTTVLNELATSRGDAV